MKFSASLLFILLTTGIFYGFCGNVEGILSSNPNQKIRLFIYDRLECIEVSSSLTDRRGHFHLSYPEGYQGMGYLEISDKGTLDLVLDNSDIRLVGDDISKVDKVKFRNSRENRLYYQFLADHKKRDDYLLDLHQRSLQKLQNKNLGTKKNNLSDQIRKSVREELESVYSLHKRYYISWYIPAIRFIHDMSVQANYNPAFISFLIEDFRRWNFADKRLINSGICSNLIESHICLINILYKTNQSELNYQANLSLKYIEKMLKRND